MTKWLLLAYVIIGLLLFDPKPFIGGDNAVYIALAESLVQGQGYNDIQLIGNPRHCTYPPGFPLLLVPFVAVFGRNIIILKLVVLCMGVVGYWFFLKIAYRVLPPFYALFVCLLYLATPAMHVYGSRVLSEIPYMTLTFGAIWFLIRKTT